jgi:hypothetical protein
MSAGLDAKVAFYHGSPAASLDAAPARKSRHGAPWGAMGKRTSDFHQAVAAAPQSACRIGGVAEETPKKTTMAI